MTPAPDDRLSPAERARRGAALMADGGARLVAGAQRLGAGWVVAAVERIVDAWGGLDAGSRDATIAAAHAAGERGAARVTAELRELLAVDVAAQRSTPLEVLRSLRREAAAVLAAAGVPEVERDPFEVRAFPDDPYGIVLRSPAELGDEELGGALLAWGLGKAQVMQARGEGAAEV